MRKIVFQMMTTLNGRLDEPYAWLTNVGDDQYQEIDRLYAAYDTVLVGRTTYEEMAAYWPNALSEKAGNDINQSMARRMHDYKKLVFSKSERQKPTEWTNVEQVIATDDQDLATYLAGLKAQSGGNIQLSGGASFAQSVIALDLVDEYHFFVYPVVSSGLTWFSRLPDNRNLQLLSAKTFDNGVVGLHNAPDALAVRERPDSFSELLQ